MEHLFYSCFGKRPDCQQKIRGSPRHFLPGKKEKQVDLLQSGSQQPEAVKKLPAEVGFCSRWCKSSGQNFQNEAKGPRPKSRIWVTGPDRTSYLYFVRKEGISPRGKLSGSAGHWSFGISFTILDPSGEARKGNGKGNMISDAHSRIFFLLCKRWI